MSQYWYFAATLPGFSFGSPLPMTEESFLQLCARNLSAEDFAEVRDAVSAIADEKLPSATRSAFLSAFLAWERGFRNELAVLRAKALGIGAEEWIRPDGASEDASRAAAACFAARNPLEAETALERERWACIERLSSLHTFDLDAIVAYRLKLAISTRLGAFDPERGRNGYRRLYDDILGPANGGADTAKSGVQA